MHLFQFQQPLSSSGLGPRTRYKVRGPAERINLSRNNVLIKYIFPSAQSQYGLSLSLNLKLNLKHREYLIKLEVVTVIYN